MQFNDLAILGTPRKTANGYLVGEARCARIGCQVYRASEIGMTGDGLITVYRPESAVMDEASLATYAGKPVTLNHPPVPVTSENWKTYAVGDVGTRIARDGDFVSVPYKIMDSIAITAIDAGTREISMGYTTPIDMVDGVAPDGTRYQAIQTGPIVINHLAIVPKARGGSELRIGDGAANWGASPVTDADKKGSQMADTLQTIMVDGIPISTADGYAAAIAKLQSTVADMTTQAEKDKAKADAEKAAMEKEMAGKDADLAASDAAKMTDAMLDARVAARADLLSKAKAIVKDIATAGLSDAAIRKAVVLAKLADASMADKSDAYIEARFDGLADAAAKSDPIGQIKLRDKSVTSLDAIYEQRDADLANAWKQKVGV
jgi:uncharacterized protein